MDEHKKNKSIEWIASIICLIGCILLVAPWFFKTEFDLPTIGIGLVGVGLVIFLIFGDKKNK